MLYYWNFIPLKVRRIFLALPLFMQWLPALYWENDQYTLKIAKVSLVYFLFFLTGLFLTIIVYSFASMFSKEIAQYLFYASYFIQIINSTVYLLLSTLMTYESIKEKAYFAKKFRIDYCFSLSQRLSQYFQNI